MSGNLSRRIASGGTGVFTPLPPISPTGKRRFAERKIQQKWSALGGHPGGEKTPGDAGLIQVTLDRHYREYVNGGALYFDNSDPEPVYVWGAIHDRYHQLGGPHSWLGWPTSGDLDFDEGGRISKFERGAIYWWFDAGAIELGNVAVRYRGIRCFGETDELSASDEPYVHLSAIPPRTGQQFHTRSQIYTDVDSGDARPDNIELYRGLPFGLAIGIVLMEYDLDNPDQYKGPIKAAVDGASVAVAGALTAIPGVGVVLGPLAGAGLAAANGDIVDALNSVVGGAPDHIGTVALNVTPKQMVTMTRAPRHGYNGLEYHLESPLISGDGASYKAVFDLEAA
jgi:hypothetical protein